MDHSHYMAATSSPCISFLFLAISKYLGFASLGGMKQKRDFHTVPPKSGEAGHSSCYFFPDQGERKLGSSFLALSDASLGDGIMQPK